ncbi:hypothetical protein Taro_046916 [Colocasia esculenta]|uniref:GDSL esterase/lipase n=1 Tax=Colocasia esculenta TaxID=4460 RepID=A0A843X7P0_COLES|nr:hypothetical protein [Colocasia esculenta]
MGALGRGSRACPVLGEAAWCLVRLFGGRCHDAMATYGWNRSLEVYLVYRVLLEQVWRCLKVTFGTFRRLTAETGSKPTAESEDMWSRGQSLTALLDHDRLIDLGDSAKLHLTCDGHGSWSHTLPIILVTRQTPLYHRKCGLNAVPVSARPLRLLNHLVNKADQHQLISVDHSCPPAHAPVPFSIPGHRPFRSLYIDHTYTDATSNTNRSAAGKDLTQKADMASSSFPAMYRCDILFLFISLFFFSFPSPSDGQSVVPAMYVFGDSLADVGNNNYLPLSLLKANFPHNGVDYPGHKATGRFSNGKNAVDFLAEKLGLQSPPPYLSLLSGSNAADAFLKGVSFASGGAGISNTINKVMTMDRKTSEIFELIEGKNDQCLTFDDQIGLFSKVYGALVQKLGSVATQEHLSHSIVTVVIGSNDLLGYFQSDPSQRAKPPQQFVDSLLFTLRDQLRRIYNLGARKIVFVGTGPIGCCPALRRRNATRGCTAEANYGSVLFNDGANSLLKGMKSELGDMTYSFFDSYTALLEYIQKPATYGFADVQSACCGGLGSLNTKVPCLPIAVYCSNRRDHVFWDLYHPTEAASRLSTDTLFDGSQPYVCPINVRELAAV